MPVSPTYPGVYIEEIASGVRTIVGVSTSDTAFVDYFSRGPMNEATRITSFDDFERKFGGLHRDSEASYAIQQFYLNGGQVGWVVRVAGGTPAAARTTLTGGSPAQTALTVRAANEGLWGGRIQIAVDYVTREADQFNLVAREIGIVRGQPQVIGSEVHRNLSMDQTRSNWAAGVVNERSQVIRVEDAGLGQRPLPSSANVTSIQAINDPNNTAFRALTNGSDGSLPGADELIDGLAALDRIAPAIFSILCLPRAANLADDAMSRVIAEANTYCEAKRAFFIVDIPDAVEREDQMRDWMADHDGIRHRNAAVYFPRLSIADALNEFRLRSVGPSGTMAGVYARIDSSRGVWKAPAGTEADLRGARLLTKLNDLENGALNPLGVNVLRTFPVVGNVSWGARTLEGADIEASEWKYIPIRRLALFIEESLSQGLQWVVFEPNDEPLFAQIRLNVGAFMQNLFQKGAFQGRSPREAYFVRCDAETTTQNDRDLGIVNILVGFAPLKPAEFVIIKIQQMAGQVQV